MKRSCLIVASLALLTAPMLSWGADAAAGKAKAGSCAGCHGANGEGKAPNPPLAGMDQAKFVTAMKDYKSGKRPHAAMKMFAAPLSDDDMANLAAHYASLKK
jgi:cytochrome c553